MILLSSRLLPPLCIKVGYLCRFGVQTLIYILNDSVTAVMYAIPCYTGLSQNGTKLYWYFLSFLNIEMMQVVKIFPHLRQGAI